MKSLRVYILEDELITQEVLKQTLESLNCIVCGMETHAERALKEIQKLTPDVAILDIRVDGDKTGIWLGNQLEIPIIYLTAFSDSKNIKNAVKTNPITYLQKPFKESELFIALELVKAKLKTKRKIVVKEKNISVKIDVENIVYAKKEDHYLKLYTHTGSKMVRTTVGNFLNQVTDDFLQVHRSYIVNKSFITGYSAKVIKIGDEEIPISSSFADNVKQELS
ncbi:MAG: response regulator transcription factor [Flavobacteriaceae bacterium]|nr:response regulator transcription factor [Flavobacteriaceae bacterium]